MTVLDDLFPHINDLSLRKITGPLNFTNPGRMDNVALLTKYREIVDNALVFDIGTVEETVKFLSIPRPFSLLDTSRLLELCPTVVSLDVAVDRILQKIAERRKVCTT